MRRWAVLAQTVRTRKTTMSVCPRSDTEFYGESFFFSCTRHVSMYLRRCIVIHSFILSFLLSHGVLFFISVLGHYPRFTHPCKLQELAKQVMYVWHRVCRHGHYLRFAHPCYRNVYVLACRGWRPAQALYTYGIVCVGMQGLTTSTCGCEGADQRASTLRTA
jgi:hypothetical protein